MPGKMMPVIESITPMSDMKMYSGISTTANGIIIVATMLLRPEGLIPSARRKAEFHEGVADTPLYDVQA